MGNHGRFLTTDYPTPVPSLDHSGEYTEDMSRKPGKRRVYSWKMALVAALGVSVVGGGAWVAKNLPYYVGETVTQVVDGDTFFIANRQPIRLFGINAPELENCLGTDARNALANLIEGKRVILRQPLTDGHGRVMALVYADGRLVNEVMLRAGLAQYKRQGESETARLKTASDDARAAAIGIYSPLCIQVEPPDPACAIKGNYDEQRGVKVYFPPSCRMYNLVKVQLFQGDRWFCSESDAEKAGFTKGEGC
jgi:endonuclease YncB( thermonuclease family)